MATKGEHNLMMKLNGQTLIDPKSRHDRTKCMARKRIFTGSGKLGGSWVQCSKSKRPGKQTCHWHRHLEDGDQS